VNVLRERVAIPTNAACTAQLQKKIVRSNADGVLYCITAAGEAAGGRIMRGKKYEQCREAEKIALRRKKQWVTPQQNNTKRAKVAVVDHSDDGCASAIQQYF